MSERAMIPIPISAAKNIADEYGYDQVVIIARKVGELPDPNGEHVTTYGKNKEHCDIAARIGSFLKYKVMGWPEPKSAATDRDAVIDECIAVASDYLGNSLLIDELRALKRKP